MKSNYDQTPIRICEANQLVGEVAGGDPIRLPLQPLALAQREQARANLVPGTVQGFFGCDSAHRPTCNYYK